MKRVLLYGDYSNVHWALAQGLRCLGVDAKVVSGGDGWKNYNRDIDIKLGNMSSYINYSSKHLFSSILKNNDVVQLINFYPLNSPRHPKLSRIVSKNIVDRLKKNNKKLFLGAFGDDSYWVRSCLNGDFEASFLGLFSNTDKMDHELHARTALKLNDSVAYDFNKYVAEKSDNILAGAYDYWLPYSKSEFASKLKFTPFPINTDEIEYTPNVLTNNKISILMGVQKDRYYWKGLDLLSPILKKFAAKYPNDIELLCVENLPYKQYLDYVKKANVVIDQVYSNTQGMNALISLAQGKIVMAGVNDNHYKLLGALDKPVLSIKPDTQFIENQLTYLLDCKRDIEQWGQRSRQFIMDNHNYIDVAGKYLKAWGL